MPVGSRVQRSSEFSPRRPHASLRALGLVIITSPSGTTGNPASVGSFQTWMPKRCGHRSGLSSFPSRMLTRATGPALQKHREHYPQPNDVCHITV
ncbi:hypothetical protein EXIGLDRAFT_96850 [Exidia glandulosa HHB12029]|uniref:Uncharacterized protein n=1 Tax=Exidia glandulosa HHB12029 TaxID=1314781 RepID=A0A165H392_EXIGL|nr:hypothetical protein EXIGLDRAFT_96850 [Exidia glandulosa HHB12029]